MENRGRPIVQIGYTTRSGLYAPLGSSDDLGLVRAVARAMLRELRAKVAHCTDPMLSDLVEAQGDILRCQLGALGIEAEDACNAL